GPVDLIAAQKERYVAGIEADCGSNGIERLSVILAIKQLCRFQPQRSSIGRIGHGLADRLEFLQTFARPLCQPIVAGIRLLAMDLLESGVAFFRPRGELSLL